jgi:iron complex outermembrane receptor protein
MFGSRTISLVGLFLLLGAAHALHLWAGQSATGTLRGRVTVRDNGAAVIQASVRILQLGRSASTDGDGRYEFDAVPAGRYDLVCHMHALSDEVRTVTIAPGEVAVADFELSFAPLRHEITVTATGREETAFQSFQAVTSLDSFNLVGKNAFALGEVVRDQPGVHARSFGPGSSRPVLRGFDGDRVLVLADGLPTGTLSAQSGEHAEPLDAGHLDRLEIVKGPATLLYGSNAIGGVVNAVTEHHLLHEHAHEGLRGQLVAEGSTNNRRASGGAGAEYGFGRWIVWGHGSRQAAGDYRSPLGRVENSETRMTSGNVGFGWFGARPFFSLGYYFNDGRFGVPYAGRFHHHHDEGEDPEGEHDDPDADQVDETFTWQNVRLTAGLKDLGGAVERIRVAAGFSRWMHRERESDVVATAFDNRTYNLRATVEQKKSGPLGGTTGVQAFHRRYRSEGEESLAPPTASRGLALFTLQELQFGRGTLQFGGRLEHAGYEPAGLPERSFTGFSGAAGLNLKLSQDTNLVANYTHSYRVPALEELYNNGPHIGNIAFEIGDPGLRREAADGLDASLRHHGDLVHARVNFFFYRIRDFVFLAFTDEERHGLRVAHFSQGGARFAGGEAQLDLALSPALWLNLGMDGVRAELTDGGVPLPRIPPLRARFGFDARYKGFLFRPEVVMASDQDRLYPTETRTAGYTVVNLEASYILARAHHAHVLAASVFNVGDRLYRNHLSFIKDLAPEMGRGVRFSYSLRFF